MRLRTLVAAVILGSLVGAVVRAAFVDLDTLPAVETPRPPLAVRAVETYGQVRLRLMEIELARIQRGIDRAAEDLRAGRPYDHDAAALLVHQHETLSTLIEAERLKERK